MFFGFAGANCGNYLLLILLQQHLHLPRACSQELTGRDVENMTTTMATILHNIPRISSFLAPKAQVLVLTDSRCFRRMLLRNRLEIPVSHPLPTRTPVTPTPTTPWKTPTRAAT